MCSISLPKKPATAIRYAYVSASDTRIPFCRDTLVVFLNGLMMPQFGWHPVIAMLLSHRKTSELPWPAMLTYDRYGQGQTLGPDPADKGKEPGHGHDVSDVVTDLDALVRTVSHAHKIAPKRLVLVANSIGCAIARMFSDRYHDSVCAIIMLDSIMANSDFVSMFPDPDDASFDESALPDGVTSEDLRHARLMFGKVFHPSVRNPEGLSRRNLAALLPLSDSPKLRGPDGQGPLLIVVGHDPDWFAKEGEEGSLHTPRAITNNYTNPIWQRYNEGLVTLTTNKRYLTEQNAPMIAPQCGHFIQRDDPLFVARLISQVTDRVREIFFPSST